MHYIIGDIHNDLSNLKSILNQICLTPNDELIVLGDVFDRGGFNADPVGVYSTLTRIQGKCTWIRGNHDQWLADYIIDYYAKSERRRKRMYPYIYNSFGIMSQKLTGVEMINLAELINALPLQKELKLNGKEYLFAHAMTSPVGVPQKKNYYLMGTFDLEAFFLEGIDGVISMCGHTPTEKIIWHRNNMYLDEYKKSIWRNEKRNVYLLDCGSGFKGGRLACMCLETSQRFYSSCE
ncbi:metallophosphoesterase [Roseburia faecis]|uniref:metallophosphoesterase n=1 Tax=Roseburia faecis TaxID=301302 RepID=UPI003F947F96